MEVWDDGAHLRNIPKGLGVGLRIAARNDKSGTGGDASGPSQELMGFPIGLVGNGAGIQNVYVGGGIPVGEGMSPGDEGPGKGGALGEVELAAEGMKGYAGHEG